MGTKQMPDTLDDILPNWIFFMRLSSPEKVAEAVQRFFRTDEATPEDFKREFNIDLRNFPNFYFEVGVTDALEGPLIPAVVKPILVLKSSHSGKSYRAYVMKHDGFFDTDQQYAWVDAQMWDKHVQDNFAQELRERAAKERERLEQAERHQEKKNDGAKKNEEK